MRSAVQAVVFDHVAAAVDEGDPVPEAADVAVADGGVEAAACVDADGRGARPGGQAAHLGGAVLGYALIRYPHSLDFLERWGRGTHRLPPRARPRTRFTDWSKNYDR